MVRIEIHANAPAREELTFSASVGFGRWGIPEREKSAGNAVRLQF